MTKKHRKMVIYSSLFEKLTIFKLKTKKAELQKYILIHGNNQERILTKGWIILFSNAAYKFTRSCRVFRAKTADFETDHFLLQIEMCIPRTLKEKLVIFKPKKPTKSACEF